MVLMVLAMGPQIWVTFLPSILCVVKVQIRNSEEGVNRRLRLFLENFEPTSPHTIQIELAPKPLLIFDLLHIC